MQGFEIFRVFYIFQRDVWLDPYKPGFVVRKAKVTNFWVGAVILSPR